MNEPVIEDVLASGMEAELMQAAVHRLLSESAQKALETMFFAMPDTVSMDPARPSGALMAASLTFQGTPPGHFGMLISETVARTLAGNFTGCDDPATLTPGEVADVMGELTNMLCGVALSELEAHANFELTTPLPVPVAAEDPGPDFSAGKPTVCRFEFADGALVFFLAFEEAA